MKYLFILCVFLPINLIFGQITPINTNYLNKIVNSIYIIEGGSHTRYPYGIKSINTNGNKEKARRICENTVRNNYVRWQNAGKTNEFLFFLADRYCPLSVDKQGNINWKKNIQRLVDGPANKV